MVKKIKLDKIGWKIFFTVFIIYIFFMTNYGGNYMAESMLDGTMALIDKGDFEISEYIKESCEVTGCDHAFYDGKIYPGYAPGNTIIPVPLYLIAKPFLNLFLPEYIGEYSRQRVILIFMNIFATMFITAFLSAFLAVLIYKFLGHFTINKKIRLLVTFVFSFGTLFFIYSTGYFSRVLASFFLFSSFYLLFLMKNKKMKKTKKLLFSTGLLSAIPITLEYSTFIIIGLLFLYLLSFLKNKKTIYYLIGLLIPIILLLSYQYFVFDDPFLPVAQYHINFANENGSNMIADANIKIIETSFPTLRILWGLSFSPEKGFFFCMPFMLLSIIGLFYGLKKRRFKKELMLISLIFIVMFLFNASLRIGWKANDAFGPRYMTAVIPFLILPSIFIIKKLFKIAVGLGLISIFINLLPVMYGRTVGCWDSNPIFNKFIPLLFEKGLRNYTLNLIDLKIFNISIFYINLIMIISLMIIGFILYKIWRNENKML